MPILSEIMVPLRGSKRRTLVFDGEPWRDVPADVAAKAGLKVGADYDLAVLADRLAEIEPERARDRAVRLLTYRDRSSRELGERLAVDGFLPGTVAAVVERLTSIGLVDDDRFVRSLARNLTQVRRLGRNRAARELAAHGVDPSVAAEALDEALSVDDERQAAATFARSFASRSGATRDKIAGRLARRGYSASVALAAARDAMEGLCLDEDHDIAPDEPIDAHNEL